MTDMTLDTAKRNTTVTILKLPSDSMKIQLIRIGISEGDTVKCIERLPGGTIVLKKNRQEVAIGSSLAGRIKVIMQ